MDDDGGDLLPGTVWPPACIQCFSRIMTNHYCNNLTMAWIFRLSLNATLHYSEVKKMQQTSFFNTIRCIFYFYRLHSIVYNAASTILLLGRLATNNNVTLINTRPSEQYYCCLVRQAVVAPHVHLQILRNDHPFP
jgi:hypothetical protein